MKWRGQNRAAELGERSTILKNTILVVDDEELERSAIQEALLDDGHKVITSGSGSHARELLASPEESIKLVLLDWIMPDVDGIEILKWIRREPDLESVEVIMLSARVDPKDVKKGVGAGAYHYLTKPFQVTELQALVRAALRNSRMKESLAKEIARSEKAFRLLEKATFFLRTVDEAESLAAGLAAACAADNSVGLMELFVNAIEHGNLGIGYAEKTRLVGEGILSQEIARLSELPENRDKKVTVEVEKLGDRAAVTVQDQGQGFDYENYLHYQGDRSLHAHGRGILLAGTLFDLTYFPPGNRVRALIQL